MPVEAEGHLQREEFRSPDIQTHVLRQIGSVAFCGLFIDSFTCMDPIIVFFTVYGLVLVLS